MAFNESYQSIPKEEALSEVIFESKEQEKNILDGIDDNIKKEATDENLIFENINYEAIKTLQEQHPNLAMILAELRKKNKLKYNENTGEMKFDINFDYSNGGSVAPDTNNYNIFINKKGLQVNGELAIPGFFNDEKYNSPEALDKLINKIKNRIIKEEGRLSQEQKESLDKTMNNAKIVFKSLFLTKIEK